METYDVIVVGLGCVGISTALYWAKKGLKVLGIEQFSHPGAIGSSSFGVTRLWRTTHEFTFRNEMMKEAIGMWKELEKESGEKLMHQFPVLTMGSVNAKFFKDIVAQLPDVKLMTSEEISEMYPALKNIPSHYKGFVNTDSGVLKARKALETWRSLAEEKYGAKLLFNTKVSKFSKNEVQTQDGSTYTAKDVVIAWGAYSINMTTCHEKQYKSDLEYYHFTDNTGLPKGIYEFDDKDNEFYGMVDGEDLGNYKMGLSFRRDIQEMLDYLRDRMPDKVDSIKYSHACFVTMVDSGEYQYKTDENGVHFAYGFCGTGFKFLPLHGKIVYDGLITKQEQKHLAPRYRAKI